MTKELEKKSAEDLMKALGDLRESLRSFRFAKEGSKTRNVREGRNVRREIARVMTEINKRIVTTKPR
ncbi:MAG: 50S ribosomal protein L29 [Minisyncoccia bacterium]